MCTPFFIIMDNSAFQHLYTLTLIPLWMYPFGTALVLILTLRVFHKPYHCQSEVYPTLNQPIKPASLLSLVNVRSPLAFSHVPPLGLRRIPLLI